MPRTAAQKTATRPRREPLVIVNIKVTPEFRVWLDRFSESTRLPKPVLMDLGLEALAIQKGFEKPPWRMLDRC